MALIGRLLTIIGLYMGMTLVFVGIQAGLIEGIYYLFTKRILETGPHGTRFIVFLSILLSIVWVCFFTGTF
ncbi:MAG: hypothetical protein JXB48_03695 [Candidatus Latescibacteria bacterium]|nr:hypothetical protein [Candidatus Latescibacterota bacterium]